MKVESRTVVQRWWSINFREHCWVGAGKVPPLSHRIKKRFTTWLLVMMCMMMVIIWKCIKGKFHLETISKLQVPVEQKLAREWLRLPSLHQNFWVEPLKQQPVNPSRIWSNREQISTISRQLIRRASHWLPVTRHIWLGFSLRQFNELRTINWWSVCNFEIKSTTWTLNKKHEGTICT